MNNELPAPLMINFRVMELSIELKDFFAKNLRKFSIKYDVVLDKLDHLDIELKDLANLIDTTYSKDSEAYREYERHLNLVNDTIICLQDLTYKLKAKANGDTSYGFQEHKETTNRYHDTYDLLMDSSNKLKNTAHLFVAKGLI